MIIPDRGLVIRKPWIDLILSGKKTWEMRSAATKIRGRIALIEAGSGLIAGESVLTGCIALFDSCDYIEHQDKHCITDLSLLEKWNCAWQLEGAKRYDEPIPYSHPMGAVIWVDLRRINSEYYDGDGYRAD